MEDAAKIENVKSFLGSTTTKGNLTLYLAKKLIDHAKEHIITATHDGLMSNRAGDITPGVSSQEEADTLMILHAVEAAREGSTVHIYSQDTDVLLLALRHVPLLGEKAALLMGTSYRRRLVLLKPIYDSLGEEKARALCKRHALTGCDTTGYIRGKSKKACLEAFLKEKPSIVSAISALGTEKVSRLKTQSKAAYRFYVVSSARKELKSQTRTAYDGPCSNNRALTKVLNYCHQHLEHGESTSCEPIANVWYGNKILSVPRL